MTIEEAKSILKAAVMKQAEKEPEVSEASWVLIERFYDAILEIAVSQTILSSKPE